jgi:hypothetical protein
MQQKENESEPKGAYKLLMDNFLGFTFGLAFLVVVAFGAFVLVFWTTDISGNSANWGVFGDYVGGVVGTLVGLATWALLVVTVYLQRDMISVARAQLRESKNELALTRVEMAQSTKALRRQAFESTFFSMLKRVRESATVLRVNLTNKGEEPIAEYLAGECETIYRRGDVYPSMQQPAEASFAEIRSIFARFPNWAEPFFRLTYHTLKLIHRSGLSADDRATYASIFRSQFTDSEVICLYYNLVSQSESGLAHYVNFYGFLKNLPVKANAERLARWPPHGSVEFSAFLGYEERRTADVTPDASIAAPEGSP